MVKHKKILVPTDFSEQSVEALRRAGKLAAKFDADVHLLHVMQPSVYFETATVSLPPMSEIDDVMHQNEEQRLQAQAEAAGFAVETHVEESVGDPANVICENATKLNADLIVIGRHDEKGMFQHMLVGSTVERVVAHAPCSVLVTIPHGLFEDGD